MPLDAMLILPGLALALTRTRFRMGRYFMASSAPNIIYWLMVDAEVYGRAKTFLWTAFPKGTTMKPSRGLIL